MELVDHLIRKAGIAENDSSETVHPEDVHRLDGVGHWLVPDNLTQDGKERYDKNRTFRLNSAKFE